MRFRFIDAERAGLAMPIFRLCRLLQVSVSGFYAWRNRGPSQRQLDDMVLLAHVRAAFRRSRESYGAERVHHELAENGIEVGRHRVARLMRGNGLSPKRKQTFKKTTDSQHNKAVASNLLDQNFSAEAPNEKWAADISYIWTAQGWLYLAVMLDLYSRRVIGWAVGARMTSDLPLRALNRAIGLRQPGAGVIHHSDRGSQYCSDAYQARLGELGFLASMSGKGNCYDNAVVETFFKTIKSELIWRTVFMSRSQAETAVAGYIDGFYNPVRRHSTLDFTSPVKFEAEAMQTASTFPGWVHDAVERHRGADRLVRYALGVTDAVQRLGAEGLPALVHGPCQALQGAHRRRHAADLRKERRRFPRRAVTHHQQTELSRRPRQVIVDETQALVDRHRR